jgi:hypothetical protein
MELPAIIGQNEHIATKHVINYRNSAFIAVLNIAHTKN